MSKITLSKNYKETYEEVSKIPQQLDDSETENFSNLVGHNVKLKILDLGCAEGKLAVSLALKGHDVTAADISENHLHRTITRAKENNVIIKTIFCNIEESILPFQNEKYDVIYFMDVVEHLRSPVSGLANIRELLKDNGILFIHTPNIFTPRRLLRYLAKRRTLANYFVPKNLGDFHLFLFDYLTLEKTLNFAGLKVTELIPTWLALFKHAKPSKYLSKKFPFLSETLLLKCVKCDSIDIEKQVLFWSNDIGALESTSLD